MRMVRYNKGLLVLRTLTCIEFWQSPTNFNAVAEPLVAQLTRPIGSVGISHAITAITALAATASSQDHHKAINMGILKLMRSESSAIRLTAVKCERSLTDRLGEEWLTMLPEMLPFITDLLEDDDEKIERETRAWIRTAEEVLGENLENMLQ
jgi:U3 small nucleolar RNA-associated protein 10